MAAATAALALAAPVASAATPGDNLAEALPLGGPLPIEVGGTNVGATKESGEVVGIWASGHSVWYAWTASVGGWVTVSTCGSPLTPVVAIFSGTEWGGLTRLTSLDGPSPGPRCPNRPSEYSFRATSGSEYRIAVDGNAFSPSTPGIGAEGPFGLRIEATPPPANDDLAAPAPIAGIVSEEPKGGRVYFGSASGYTWGATKQAGEPDHGGDEGGGSVWYSWTAPESGEVRLSVCCNTVDPVLGVYTGGSLGSLSPVGFESSFMGGRFTATAGTGYLIAVDGRRDAATGEAASFGFHLTLTMLLAPGPGRPQQDSLPATSPPPQAEAPPRTILVKRSIDPDRASATFVFRSSAPGSRYRCKLDRGRYAPCRSPKTYRRLAGGRHVFKAVAVSAAGVADPTPLVARLSLPKAAIPDTTGQEAR